MTSTNTKKCPHPDTLNDVCELCSTRSGVPTVEQWQAAKETGRSVEALAFAFAEREAKLRARVADLEAKQARLKHLANEEVAACALHIDSLEKLLAAYRATVAECVKVLRSVDDDASADPGVREEVRELVAKLDAAARAAQAISAIAASTAKGGAL